MQRALWRVGRGIYTRIPYEQQATVRRVIGTLSLPFSLGNAVECPCCGWRFRRFLPAGVEGRQNARCPRCGSLERTRLLALYLRERTTVFAAPQRMLDVAPETHLQRVFKRLPHLEHISLDLASPEADIQGDVTSLPFGDGEFDVVLCNHVLEHVPDDGKAMRELRRVCKPGGLAVLQVPLDRSRATTYEDPSITDPVERLKAFGQADHVRIYGRDYPDRLAAAGFAVEVIPYAKELGDEKRRRYGLLDDDLFIGRA